MDRKPWTYIDPKSSKAKQDNIFIIKKWINSVLNCEAFSSFGGVSSDHRFITTKILLILCRNKKETVKITHWSSLTNRDVRNKYMVTERNRFDTLQEIPETHTPNDEYENFVSVHMETAECIPTKPRAKYTVPLGDINS